MNLLLSTLLLLAANQVFGNDQKVRYDNYRVHRVTPHNQEEVDYLRTLEEEPQGFQFWTGVTYVNQSVDIMVPPHLQNHFVDTLSNIHTVPFIENVQELIDNERNTTGLAPRALEWTDYHTLDEINEWLVSLTVTYPDIVTLLEGGTSYEGRTINGIRLSFSPENENKAVFIEGNIHAREWITSAVVTWITNELLTSEDAAVRKLATTYDWYIFPVFNPDGFTYTHETDRLWRKTRTPYGSCFGADPNRNWGFYWNTGGASSSPCSETYRGSAPFSEQSTYTLAQYITTIADKLEGYIAFHSYSQLLLLPYGFSNTKFDNYNDLYNVGVKAINNLATRYNTQYRTGNIVDLLYVASGGSMDWVKGIYETPITYTYELRDTGRYGFVLPADQIVPTAEETLDSLLTIFEEFQTILPYKKDQK